MRLIFDQILTKILHHCVIDAHAARSGVFAEQFLDFRVRRKHIQYQRCFTKVNNRFVFFYSLNSIWHWSNTYPLFMSWIASNAFSTLTIGKIGPKISSCITGSVFFTLIKSVGSMKRSSAFDLPPTITSAPFNIETRRLSDEKKIQIHSMNNEKLVLVPLKRMHRQFWTLTGNWLDWRCDTNLDYRQDYRHRIRWVIFVQLR